MISSYFRFASFDRQFGRFADFQSFVGTSSEKKGNEIDDGVDKTSFMFHLFFFFQVDKIDGVSDAFGLLCDC